MAITPENLVIRANGIFFFYLSKGILKIFFEALRGIEAKTMNIGIGIALTAAAAVATPAVVSAGIAAAGFAGTGITAGSAAASIMSLYGGAVPAGSLCAILQSVGAAGLSTTAATVASAVGSGFTAACIAYVF
ncbi:hypothetical protein SELMODRAFT_442876 [Selaginella moellendorffii]|uniref:Uncharacterized protein n=1 Tax=Selaginella moellendorffii TaxID=88036 RepID=D8RWU1_SELML|nr:hypothetical protein SELMODRAFT_442876 [Selaginella moellendorffii]